MSSARKRERREEVLRIHEEGRIAARIGASRESCPYTYCNKMQWEQGYNEELREMMRREEEECARQEERALRSIIREEIEKWMQEQKQH